VQLGQLQAPFRGFRRSVRGFVELHEALERFADLRFDGGRNPVLLLFHAFVRGKEEWFGFAESAQPEQATTEQAT